MGQKVRPTGFRVGIFEDWKSRWYAGKKEFSELLIEDFKIRAFLKKHPRVGKAGVPKIEIDRTRDEVKVTVFAAKPGIIAGRKGAPGQKSDSVDEVQEELQALTGRRINLKVQEVANPQIDSQLVAEDIGSQLERRSSFRRTMKRAGEEVLNAGAKGIKIMLSGRLGGSEMARQEKLLLGSVPLSTLRAKIDYGFAEASTPQGNIGIKVWVNQGFYEETGNASADAATSQISQKPKRKSKR